MNIHKLSILVLIIILTSCSYDLDDNLSATPDINNAIIINSNSNLFNNIKQIVNSDDRPDQSIACIDFIYPLTLFVFDNTSAILSTNLILNDEQFNDLIDNLELEHSISISFPITSTLESGEEFIVNTEEELKEAINNCLSEELLLECNALIENCVWKIGYSYNYENPYLAGMFQGNNGFTTLNIDGEIFIGSWSPLIIEDELHININLNNNQEIGEFFNFDWEVTYIDENSLLLTNNDRELVINQRCDNNFTDCGNFIFEECELVVDEGISEFILDNYSECIFDTLELNNDDDNYIISYYENEEDSISMVNPIVSEELYITTATNQILYVRINNVENDIQYYIIISLSVISC